MFALFSIALLLLSHCISAAPQPQARRWFIDLAPWKLNLPMDRDVKAADFQDEWFENVDDGIKMTVDPASPGNCIPVKNSQHCRTELHQTLSWDPKDGPHTLTCTLTVMEADKTKHGTVIGQVHMDFSASVRPVAELFYNSKGELAVGIEQTRKGGDEIVYPLKVTVPLKQKFTYTLTYEEDTLTVGINGKTEKLPTNGLNEPKSYFQAGNYNQALPNEQDNVSIVVFHSIQIS